MRNLAVILISCFALFVTSAIAGPGHEHSHGHAHGPVSADTVSNKAMKKVAQLAKAGKIDASWAGIRPASVEQKTYSKGPEWVVTFKNDRLRDISN